MLLGLMQPAWPGNGKTGWSVNGKGACACSWAPTGRELVKDKRKPRECRGGWVLPGRVRRWRASRAAALDDGWGVIRTAGCAGATATQAGSCSGVGAAVRWALTRANWGACAMNTCVSAAAKL